MDDSVGEAGGQSQVHVCSSYSLSLPSQPPDIKNWFSSYVYDSPEVPELVADNDGGNGSETQDPFEHSSLKGSLQDGGVALGENCLGGQSEPEIFSGKYLVPVDGNVIEPAPKRKQSLRALFGSFLHEVEDVKEPDSHGLFPVQQNALKHVSDCTSLPLDEICEAHSEKRDCTTSLPDSTRHSQEGTIIEHSKLLVNYDRISSADTQESTPADEEVESKKSANCDDARLADIGKGSEDVINHTELPVSFKSTVLAGTERKMQDGVDQSTHLVSRNSLSLADTEYNSALGETDIGENSSLGETDHCKVSLDRKRRQEIVASDGFIAIKRRMKQAEEHKTHKIQRHLPGGEKENGNLKENVSIPDQKVFLVQEQTRRPLTDRTNFSEVNASPTPEPNRKWKCPRKGKPYVGRPMKQLRLEQWVRRLN